VTPSPPLLEEGRGEASAEVVEDLEEAVRMHEEV